MQRNKAIFPISKDMRLSIKKKMLNWLRQFSIFTYLDNNFYEQHAPQRFEVLIGVTNCAKNVIKNTFPEKQDWHFGHLSYDWKNKLHKGLKSQHKEYFNFGDNGFFCPDTVIFISSEDKNNLHIHTIHSPDDILSEILHNSDYIENKQKTHPAIQWESFFDKNKYKETVEKIKKHIASGDCYELNLCAASFAHHVDIDAFYTFDLLNQLNPAPFAALYKYNDDYLISASPERFLFKQDKLVLSQPIKGTIKRMTDFKADEKQKETLAYSEKDIAENVMITDLVRNDLAKSCRVGSIQVSELFGLYSFAHVHHLISTIEGVINEDLSIQACIEAAFPMGSMTGAPKKIVMELIDYYEKSRRELYAGSIGYITPQGDFDFNVIIRSLLYNARSCYLSYQSGGAITYDSDAESEWNELRLKAKAMENIFL